MLLSPGHSPRNLSPPSPSQTAAPHISRNASSSTKRVLDEDTYVAAIEKIVERDFFPDISKLRDRLDWLQAIKSGDPIQIRDAQLKIIERRFGKRVNSSDTTDAQGSTLSSSFTSFDDFDNNSNNNITHRGGDLSYSVDTDDGIVDNSLNLDEFFKKYTSEDNESFSKVLDKVNKKRKERYAHLYLQDFDKESIEDAAKRRGVITDGYGTSDQPPSTLEGWRYTPNNLLMYHPHAEAPLTDEERANRLKGLTKEISRFNTRFHGKMLDSGPKHDGSVDVLYTPVVGATPLPSWSGRDGEKGNNNKYDLEDLRKTPNAFYVDLGKKADNGYSFVRTPSPAPGVDQSPFITWGEIEGTPLRLDPEDTPIDIGGSGDGPHFKIPNPPARDVKAHSLSREAARKLRERSRMFQKPPLPSPARGGSASPAVRTLSPAAQKFVRNAIFKSSSSFDETLRASYRGASPGVGTPKSVRSVSRLGRDGSLSSRSPSVR
ncbi:hypothetical protein K2173_011952 [Erythroxylum novogranatense]|uniref:Protein DGCR14 n=1 Tax=Erythroxylum novogranatense TaxID=1862640 RepID=A0AAV8U9Q8_9ROSI|nr:hypothetical protein K2173_011952 [Erythroxylum novogranatense]